MLRKLAVDYFKRRFSGACKKPAGFNVCVCGATGGIGQPLSLLLRMHPLVKKLKLYDITPITGGIKTDLAHMDMAAEISCFTGAENLSDAMQCSEVLVVVSGVPRKPGMKRDDVFEVNAKIIKNIAESAAVACPKALICIVTNPVNSTVPLAAEILKKAKVYDPNRLFGVTTLDLVRASKFVGDFLKIDPKKVNVPVIGGHAGETILPIISCMKPEFKGCKKDKEKLIKRIRGGGSEVINAKAGGGSATLSMAYATARFTNALLKGLNGEPDIIEYAYVGSKVTEAPFFATACCFGKNGVEKNLGLPKLDEDEQAQLKKCVEILKKAAKEGAESGKAGCS